MRSVKFRTLGVLLATLALLPVAGSTVARPHGDFVRFTGILSPELGEARSVTIYLPPSYTYSDKRYPVLYLQDGQNIFNPFFHEATRWKAWQAADAHSDAGREVILVAVDNRDRLNEYSPYREPAASISRPRADKYADFLALTLKPWLDARLRTLPEARHTGVLGSSMGGLVSLYAARRHPGVFGFAGVLSPSLWVGNKAIFYSVAARPEAGVRYYLSAGTDEGAGVVSQTSYMAKLLKGQGSETMLTVARGEAHNEAAWIKRLPEALGFFLAAER